MASANLCVATFDRDRPKGQACPILDWRMLEFIPASEHVIRSRRVVTRRCRDRLANNRLPQIRTEGDQAHPELV